MVDSKTTLFSVFSGVGWLDAAARVVLPDVQPLACVEWEAYAASCLLARMEDASMEPCPVFCGSLADIDARPFHGVVDILLGGPPCQPYSSAGRQAGNADRRSFAGKAGIPEIGDSEAGPLGHLLRITDEMRPAVVWFENVPPWIRQGHFREFGSELCRLGYDIIDPVCLTASAVGASHRRERAFVMAYDTSQRGRCRRLSERERWLADFDAERGCSGVNMVDARCGAERKGQRPDSAGEQLAKPAKRGRGKLRKPSRGNGQSDGRNEAMADATGAGQRIGSETVRPAQSDWAGHDMGDAASTGQEAGNLQHDARRKKSRPEQGSRGGVGLADAESQRPGGRANRTEPSAVEGYSVGVDQVNANGQRLRTQSHGEQPSTWAHPGIAGVFAPGPQCEQWPSIVADFPHLAPAIEPGLRLLADGCAYLVDESRADQLRCAGNGVVALEAATALIVLLNRLNRRLNQPG